MSLISESRNSQPISWRWHAGIALFFAVIVSGSLLARRLSGADYNFFFWPPGGIALGVLLLFGWRIFPAILAGDFFGFFIWQPTLQAGVYFCVAAVNSAIGYTLVGWVWRHGSRYTPSVRFFAIMIVAGGLIPALISALPTWYFFEQYNYSQIGFSQGFMAWWLGDCISVIVFTPAVLLFRSSFREDGFRSFRSMLLTVVQIGLCLYVAGLVLGDNDPHPILAITILIVMGCMIALRCGVTGMILANVALLLVAVAVQTKLTGNPDINALEGQVNFDGIIFETTAICLLVAGGFHDYLRADQALHGVSARVLKAQEIERRRLSSDLHDGVSQVIVAAMMRMRAAAMGLRQERIDGEAVRSEVQTAANELSDVLKELRRTIAGLRPEMLDQAAFASVLADYCTQLAERFNVTISFLDETAGAAEQLSIEVREHLFRLLQEAMSNALQHGQPKEIEVSLVLMRRNPDLLRLRIEDHGKGFDTQAHESKDRLHIGLHTMQERTLLVNGTLQIESTLGHGTIVTVEVPVVVPSSVTGNL